MMPQPTANGARQASSISVHSLHKAFSSRMTALDGVDLEIKAGEFFTLLGPSGCGKTTLLRIIAGLEQPDSGSIAIGRRVLDGVPAHQRSVNTVFQSYALFPNRNVRDNIGFGLQMQRVKRQRIQQRVEAMAEITKVHDLLDRNPDQLSGGQKQRVALARALINEPDVLLLDEPLSALDAGLRGQLQVELQRLQRQLGMTFVFVTHDQQEAMVMSHRMAVLHEGRLQQVGSPQVIYEQPATLFVARFMGHQNVFEIQQRGAEEIVTEFGCLKGLFPAGSHVLLREEALSLTHSDVAGPNRLPARVEECLYRGGSTEYRLFCGNARLTVRSHNLGQTLFTAGQDVTIDVAPEAVAILPG
ncbi:MAG: ABC transporter ATP-binding protein [Gammaproteobacteria bacterium]|nr:ABC transporter ATP-binding protein [Gammaproteobacteria bacterium]